MPDPEPSRATRPVARDVLLERETDLAAIDASLAAAARTDGTVTVIAGPPGIGKTTLLRAARERAHAAGLHILDARGSEIDRDLAYGGLRQVFLPAVRAGTELQGAAAIAAPALGLAEAPAATDPAAVAHGAYWLLAELAEAHPLAVFVDDLQWIDPASAEVIVHLCTHIEDLAVAVLVATRDDAETMLALDPVLRAPHGRELSPAPLSADAVEALAASAFASSRIDGAFAAACHEVTGGVPFLVHELFREIAAQRIAPDATSVAHVRELAPRAIQRSVLARLMRVPRTAQELARAVAVLPPGADAGLAGAIAGITADALPEATRALVAAHVLRDVDGLDFAHPVMRASVVADLGPTGVASGHARAAAELTRRRAAPESIALHLLHTPPAGDGASAAVLHAAGSSALRAGAHETAHALLRRAVEEPPAERLLAAALADLGRAQASVGDPKAIETLSAALEAEASPDARADTAIVLAEALSGEAGDGKAALATLWKEVERLPQRDDRALALLARIGLLAERHGLSAERDRCVAAIPSDLRGDSAAERSCLVLQAIVQLLLGGTADDVRRFIEPAVSHPRFVDEEIPGSASTLIGCAVLRVLGELSRAEILMRAGAERAQRAGRRSGLAETMAAHSALLYRRGDLLGAEAESGASFTLVGEGAGFATSIAGASYGRALIARGKLDAAEDVLASLPAPRGAQSEFYDLRVRAELAAARGDAALAAELHLASREHVGTTPNPADEEWGHDAAKALAAADRREEARAICQELEVQARHFGNRAALGWVLAAAGVVDRDPERLRQGVPLLAVSEYRLAHAIAVVDLGMVMRQAGLNREAREHLKHGLDAARSMGAGLLGARAEEELRAAGGRAVNRALSGVDSLTAGELRVAQLARAGLTNREVAQQLFLTMKTVEMHLRNTYRKLDIKGRAGLAEALGD